MYITFIEQDDDDGLNLFSFEMESLPLPGTTLHYSKGVLDYDRTKWSDDSIEHWEKMEQTDWVVVSNHIDVRNNRGTESPVCFCILKRTDIDGGAFK